MQMESEFGGAIGIANELAAKSEALLSTCSQADSTVISNTIPTTMFVQIILNLTNELKRLQGVINTLQKKLRPGSTTTTPTITFPAATISRVQTFIDSSELPGNFLETSRRGRKPNSVAETVVLKHSTAHVDNSVAETVVLKNSTAHVVNSVAETVVLKNSTAHVVNSVAETVVLKNSSAHVDNNVAETVDLKNSTAHVDKISEANSFEISNHSAYCKHILHTLCVAIKDQTSLEVFFATVIEEDFYRLDDITRMVAESYVRQGMALVHDEGFSENLYLLLSRFISLFEAKKVLCYLYQLLKLQNEKFDTPLMNDVQEEQGILSQIDPDTKIDVDHTDETDSEDTCSELDVYGLEDMKDGWIKEDWCDHVESGRVSTKDRCLSARRECYKVDRISEVREELNVYCQEDMKDVWINEDLCDHKESGPVSTKFYVMKGDRRVTVQGPCLLSGGFYSDDAEEQIRRLQVTLPLFYTDRSTSAKVFDQARNDLLTVLEAGIAYSLPEAEKYRSSVNDLSLLSGKRFQLGVTTLFARLFPYQNQDLVMKILLDHLEINRDYLVLQERSPYMSEDEHEEVKTLGKPSVPAAEWKRNLDALLPEDAIAEILNLRSTQFSCSEAANLKLRLLLRHGKGMNDDSFDLLDDLLTQALMRQGQGGRTGAEVSVEGK